MRWKGKNSRTHIIALLAVFIAMTGFSITGIEFLSTVISSPKGEDGLSELVYHFPDQAGEPALNTITDDSDFSLIRIAHQRFFHFFGPIGLESLFNFSRFQSHSTENSFDNKNTIPIKLRI